MICIGLESHVCMCSGETKYMSVDQAYRRTDSGAMEVGCVQPCALQRRTRRMPTAANLSKVAGEPLRHCAGMHRALLVAARGRLGQVGWQTDSLAEASWGSIYGFELVSSNTSMRFS